MSFWEKLKDLFRGNKEEEADKKEGAAEAEEAKEEKKDDAPIGDDELHTFTITFRHSAKSIDFEGTWNQVRALSGKFAGSRGLKMNNFYVPWDEVAFIYCGDKVDGKKEEKNAAEAKPGDEVPATGDAKKLGAETMEILSDEEKKESEAKDESKAEEPKTEEKAEEPKAEAKDEGDARDASLDAVKVDGAEGVTAEEIK